MRWLTFLITIFFPWTPTLAQSVPFDSGSNGSFGPILVDQASGDVTIDLPPDGIVHATTVDIQDSRTLRFNRNALNTPVYLLATGDINIGNGVSASFINISGQIGNGNAGGIGGPGGFDGGPRGIAGAPGGAGFGPGAGLGSSTSSDGGHAGHFFSGGTSTLDGAAYGSQLLIPILGGSGGGGSTILAGSGGGGAIVLASNTSINILFNSGINAWSNRGNGGIGSGGAIRLIAPVVTGRGGLYVSGALTGGSAASGAGRIRIDTIDRSNIAFSINPSPSVLTVSSFMQVFPTTMPRLDIIEAAGQSIPEGSPNPQTIFLPTGSPSLQPFTVQARDFVGIVPIRIVVTPESGDPIIADTDIDMATGNPATVTVNMDLPANVPLHVHAWTR